MPQGRSPTSQKPRSIKSKRIWSLFPFQTQIKVLKWRMMIAVCIHCVSQIAPTLFWNTPTGEGGSQIYLFFEIKNGSVAHSFYANAWKRTHNSYSYSFDTQFSDLTFQQFDRKVFLKLKSEANHGLSLLDVIQVIQPFKDVPQMLVISYHNLQ